jgi:hypothetical protein
MAGYGSNPGAQDNPYSDGAMSAPMEKAPAEQEQEGGETAVLPKSILAGKDFKVGEEVVLKITAIHGDEIQVEYAQEKPSEGAEEAPAEAPVEAPAPNGGGGDAYASMME